MIWAIVLVSFSCVVLLGVVAIDMEYLHRKRSRRILKRMERGWERQDREYEAFKARLERAQASRAR